MLRLNVDVQRRDPKVIENLHVFSMMRSGDQAAVFPRILHPWSYALALLGQKNADRTADGPTLSPE